MKWKSRVQSVWYQYHDNKSISTFQMDMLVVELQQRFQLCENWSRWNWTKSLNVSYTWKKPLKFSHLLPTKATCKPLKLTKTSRRLTNLTERVLNATIGHIWWTLALTYIILSPIKITTIGSAPRAPNAPEAPLGVFFNYQWTWCNGRKSFVDSGPDHWVHSIS